MKGEILDIEGGDSVDTIQIPSESRIFLENLINEAGVQVVDEEMKEQILIELYSRLDNFMVTTIIKNMPPEYLEEFIRLNEENRPREEIDKFMTEKMPNSGEIFAQALIDFRDIYLGNVVVTEPKKISGQNPTN